MIKKIISLLLWFLLLSLAACSNNNIDDSKPVYNKYSDLGSKQNQQDEAERSKATVTPEPATPSMSLI